MIVLRYLKSSLQTRSGFKEESLEIEASNDVDYIRCMIGSPRLPFVSVDENLISSHTRSIMHLLDQVQSWNIELPAMARTIVKMSWVSSTTNYVFRYLFLVFGYMFGIL